ncbi:MAG: 30S ribosomal protein S8 [Candidatus Pacebacteria bacterium]|nr:30S ribosomal protein S8 [Candidatus Paceibacterota bacterium]
MSRDIVSELIIGIKNAGMAGNETVRFPYSELKATIADILKKEGYIDSFSKIGKTPKRKLEIGIAYKDKNTPKIRDIVRVSKLSKRIYFGNKDIKRVKGGYGKLIVSTSKGVMTGDKARKEGIGGEPLFKVW